MVLLRFSAMAEIEELLSRTLSFNVKSFAILRKHVFNYRSGPESKISTQLSSDWQVLRQKMTIGWVMNLALDSGPLIENLLNPKIFLKQPLPSTLPLMMARALTKLVLMISQIKSSLNQESIHLSFTVDRSNPTMAFSYFCLTYSAKMSSCWPYAECGVNSNFTFVCSKSYQKVSWPFGFFDVREKKDFYMLLHFAFIHEKDFCILKPNRYTHSDIR